jgi:hypothetical protein
MSNETEPQTSMIGSATTEAEAAPPASPQAAPDPTPPAEGTSLLGEAGVETEGEGAEGEEKGAPSAPEPLTLEQLSLPEGFSIPEELGGAFVELMNNPPESRAEFANKMLELHTNLLQSVADEHASRWEALQEEWRAGVRSLPEIGGDNLDRSLGQIAKVIDRYGDKEVRDALSVTGAGNHPALVKFFHAIAKDLNEKPPVKGDLAAGQPKDRASRMFGDAGAN